MDLKKWNILLLIVLWPTVLSLGCGNKQEETSAPSVDAPTDPTDPDAAPPNVVNNIGFYVKADTDDKYPFYMSKGTNFATATFNTSCSILTTAATSQDIDCRVDALESDLNFHGITFNFNVPPNFCSYMSLTPSWYYNFESGIGPTAVTVEMNQVGDVSTLTSCTITNSQGTVGPSLLACTSNPEVNVNSKGEISCVYDRTSAGRPNCCFGSYSLTEVKTGDSPGSETSLKSWGGDYASCIGGIGAVSWDAKSAAGLPKTLVYYTEEGLNEEWKLVPNIGTERVNNYSIANFYTPAKHGHTGFVQVTASTKPYAVDPVDDRDGTPMTSGQDRITLQCLDKAWEVKHRIELQIREWNTYAEFLLLGTSNGASGDPDVTGTEGTDCDYTNTFGGPCDDQWDFDALVDSLTGGIYDQTGSVTERINWFPREGKED